MFFFKQKTAYEMRISDWSSDVCSSDLVYELWSGMWRRPLCASARALAIPMAENEQPESLPRMDQLTREGSLWFARMRGPDAQSYRPQFEHWLSLGDRKSTRLNSSH